MKEINFDMDGTLADFYGVENWLEDLENYNTRPYEQARPLFNFSVLAKQIHRLQKLGYKVNIISWLSKTGTEDFNARIIQAKKKWLSKHLPSVQFNKITIVEYGTPKSLFGNGILFDDELNNRREWRGISLSENRILEILKTLN